MNENIKDKLIYGGLGLAALGGVGWFLSQPTQAPEAPVTPFSLEAEAQTEYEDRDYDCADFSSHSEAQDFFESQGSGDPHRLDRDGDGLACETL